jgi:type II secretory pathway pseudopilin PulG
MKNDGFSLVEVLVLSAVLSATALALGTIIYYSAGVVNAARAKANQRQLAEVVSDRLRNSEECKAAIGGQGFDPGMAEKKGYIESPDMSQRFQNYTSGSPVRINLTGAGVGVLAPGAKLIPTPANPKLTNYQLEVVDLYLLDAVLLGPTVGTNYRVYNVSLWSRLKRIDGQGNDQKNAAGANMMTPTKLAEFSVFVDGGNVIRECQALQEYPMARCGGSADAGVGPKIYLPGGYNGVAADDNGCVPLSAFSTRGVRTVGPPGPPGYPGWNTVGAPGAPGAPGVYIPPPAPAGGGDGSGGDGSGGSGGGGDGSGGGGGGGGGADPGAGDPGAGGAGGPAPAPAPPTGPLPCGVEIIHGDMIANPCPQPPPPPKIPPGGCTYCHQSDRRVKKELGEFEYGLNEILEMRPIWFEYNGQAGTRAGELHAGVIAQELEKVAPRLVERKKMSLVPGGPTTDVLSVRYEEFDMMLIRAVQEQQKMLKDLRCKLEKHEHPSSAPSAQCQP